MKLSQCLNAFAEALSAACASSSTTPNGKSKGGDAPKSQPSLSSGLLKLTRPDGSPVFINPTSVILVRPPLHNENGNSVVEFIKGQQACMETVDVVVESIIRPQQAGSQTGA